MYSILFPFAEWTYRAKIEPTFSKREVIVDISLRDLFSKSTDKQFPIARPSK